MQFFLLSLWGFEQTFAAPNILSQALPRFSGRSSQLNRSLTSIQESVKTTSTLTNTTTTETTTFDDWKEELIEDWNDASDLKKTEVNVELTELLNQNGTKVVSVSLKVSLLDSSSTEPKFFICSYLVPKTLQPAHMWVRNEETNEWERVTKAEARYDQRNFVESEDGHEDEVARGTRMSCAGRIVVRDTLGGASLSLFKNLRVDTASDITSLQMQIYDEAESNGAQLIFSKEDGDDVGKFYVTGEDNENLFREQGMLNSSPQTERRRRLDIYKFKCRDNKPKFTIRIGIFADTKFCEETSKVGGRGIVDVADCENSAMAVVAMTSSLMQKQLNIQLEMADFFYLNWPCNPSAEKIDFRNRLNDMKREVSQIRGKKLAVYHYFTYCLPACVQSWGCGLTLGLAYTAGINIPDHKNENLGVNRFRDHDSFTFIHEMGHSLGFGHFFSTSDRDVNDKNKSTQYGVMDYTRDAKLEDPFGRRPPGGGSYNGVQQFTPRHEENVYGSVTPDIACDAINKAYSSIDRFPEKFSRSTTTTNTRTRTNPPVIARPTTPVQWPTNRRPIRTTTTTRRPIPTARRPIRTTRRPIPTATRPIPTTRTPATFRPATQTQVNIRTWNQRQQNKRQYYNYNLLLKARRDQEIRRQNAEKWRKNWKINNCEQAKRRGICYQALVCETQYDTCMAIIRRNRY